MDNKTQKDLFGAELKPDKKTKRTREEVLNDYEGFVEKFKPKKTTDDCHTPREIYDALVDYIGGNVRDLKGLNIVRPFFPGGDYKSRVYKADDVVIDNPPFSILAKILDFYISKGVRFWLFAPHLTLFQYADRPCTLVVCGTRIIYENGARVNTSFVTNLYPGEQLVNVNADLRDIMESTQERIKRQTAKHLPKYVYPENVATAAELGDHLAKRGVNFIIRRDEASSIDALDSQRAVEKTIFGSGLLLSTAKARAKEEAKARAKEEATVWSLSPRELEMIRAMDESRLSP